MADYIKKKVELILHESGFEQYQPTEVEIIRGEGVSDKDYEQIMKLAFITFIREVKIKT